MALSVFENAIIVLRMALPDAAAAPGATLTFRCNGKTATTVHHPGTVLLQAAREAGLRPPSSCEQGNCATCMAKLTDGTVSMRVNDVLTDAEVADGWILTCQSEPTSDVVSVDYDF